MTLELDGEPICLASLVGDDAVLTAKHCVQRPGDPSPVEPARLRVRAEDGLKRILSVRVVGEGYESLESLSGRDIALLILDAPAAGAILPIAEDSAMHEVACAASAVTGNLQGVGIRAVENRAMYTDGVTCGGDSGGPLLSPEGAILGVASWRSPGECGEGTSVFTRADVYRDWLRAELSQGQP